MNYRSVRRPFRFRHRARAARRACSRRCSAVNRLALVFPPLRPQATTYRRTSLGIFRTLQLYVAGRHTVNDLIDYA